MPVRPPRALAPKNDLPKDPLSAALEHEVLAEKAATYGRLVKRLEQALDALRGFDSAHGEFADARRRREGAPGSCPGQAPTGRRACALASLRSDTEDEKEAERQRLLSAAGEALWHVVVQRDLCGFRNHALFYKELKVPPAVRLRMGQVRPR